VSADTNSHSSSEVFQMLIPMISKMRRIKREGQVAVANPDTEVRSCKRAENFCIVSLSRSIPHRLQGIKSHSDNIVLDRKKKKSVIRRCNIGIYKCDLERSR